MFMGAFPRFTFIAKAPQGLSEYQEEKKVLLPFTTQFLWNNTGQRTVYKKVGRGPGSGLGKHAGRGMKGMHARAGGQVNRGFEGGHANLRKRFPKRGFKANTFNIKQRLEQLNLGKLAYYITKGDIDPSKTITMKNLLECGCFSKIKFGVKVLSKGAEKIKELGIPIHIEASDASLSAIETLRSTGGSIRVVYRTPLLMRYHLKPHKFSSHKELKTPMPPQKRVIKLEKLRDKGLEVEYPRAPWFTDNKEAILAEEAERIKRMQQGQYADILPQLPADRSAGSGKDRPRVERQDLPRVYKFPL